jgi:predicted DNA-binding transcriptional regulator AlpA
MQESEFSCISSSKERLYMNELIKARDFIKAIGISKPTLYRGIKSNKYPYCCHVRLGDSNHIYFPKILLTELCVNALEGTYKAGGLN